MKDETPIYPHSVIYAREHDELPEYRASFKAHTACRDAIDAAISEHYRNNSLSTQAIKDVVAQFGFDRTLYVLANTVQHKDWDGRISNNNKQWAQGFPVVPDTSTMGNDRTMEFVANSHPGLLDIFVREARHEFLLTQPLTAVDIKDEAARILGKLQAPREPNSPSGTHFMAEVSPDFMLRAKSKDTDRLASLLPFKSLSLSTLNDRKGVFAMISKDEDRSQPLRSGRKSIRDQLKANTAATQKSGDAPKHKRDDHSL